MMAFLLVWIVAVATCTRTSTTNGSGHARWHLPKRVAAAHPLRSRVGSRLLHGSTCTCLVLARPRQAAALVLDALVVEAVAALDTLLLRPALLLAQPTAVGVGFGAVLDTVLARGQLDDNGARARVRRHRRRPLHVAAAKRHKCSRPRHACIM